MTNEELAIFVGNKNLSAHSYTPPFNFIMIKITSRIAWFLGRIFKY